MSSSSTQRRRSLVAAVAGATIVAALGAAPVHATYPGDNGAIVFPAALGWRQRGPVVGVAFGGSNPDHRHR